MLYKISNEHLTVCVDSLGAELQSVRNTESGLEYLWQGNPEVWEGRAPLLFPIIGRLKNGTYSLGGKTYAMGTHGFAKDSQFRGMKKGDGIVSFYLNDSPATRASWPFAFELEIRYTLSGATIRKEHIIHNESPTEMLYEIGGHDGYNLALLAGEKMTDYFLEFEGRDAIRSLILDEDVMITREKRNIPLKDGRLELDMSLFDGDALILEEESRGGVLLANTKNAETIRVDSTDFRYLGVWTMPGKRETNYICIEPWSSLPDCAYLDDKLENKRGIRHLAAGESETLAYTLEFGARLPPRP